MITTTIDVKALTKIENVVLNLQQSDSLLREIAVSMQALTSDRIHKEGKKSDNTAIGEYSTSYLNLRQKNPYNRSSDKKVILSLTGQMENDYKVIPLSDTEYALGFDNQFNADKAEWMTDGTKASTVKAHTRKVKEKSVEVKSYTRKAWAGFGSIWALTEDELQKLRDIVKDFIQRTFS